MGQLAAKLGPDTGAALRRAPQSPAGNAAPEPGPAKLLQEWKKAWADWDEVIGAACDEEGEYVIREHDWEQPYFDPLSVTGDLEPIAARMAALLPRIFDHGLDPDFSFADEVADCVEEIASSFPEWLSPFDCESFRLGSKATGCLLQWELRVCRRQGRSLFQLIDKLRGLEQSNRGLDLDDKTMSSFVRGLGKDAGKNILEGIRAHKDEDRWMKVLNSARSGWFLIYQDLCRGQDRSGYLETCRAKISQDWSLAVPVVKALVRKGANEELCQVCAEAATAFLYIRDGSKWGPRETLIASLGGGPHGEKPDERFIFLLEAWQRAAVALGRNDTAEAIRLQSALLACWRNWDKAFAAFNRVPAQELSGMRDKLFAQWRSLVAENSASRFTWDRFDTWEKPRAAGAWVCALVDAARQGGSGSVQNRTGQYKSPMPLSGNEPGGAGFMESIRLLLKEIEADRTSLRRGLNEPSRLSLDLENGDWLKAFSPTLARVLGNGWGMDKTLLASRRNWLRRLGAAALIPELKAFWKRNLLQLVPDPASNAGPDYERCVDWLQALREIDPEAARRLLDEWGTVHWRRRNLWSMLRKRGLPVPDLRGRRK